MTSILGDTKTARPIARGLRHALTVWLALLGVVAHIAAAGACTTGTQAGFDGARGPFPICHAQAMANDDGQTQGHHPDPSHHDECPFCSMHCHAAAALPQAVGVPTPVLVATIEPARTPLARMSAPRCHAGASPRGPPLRA